MIHSYFLDWKWHEEPGPNAEDAQTVRGRLILSFGKCELPPGYIPKIMVIKKGDRIIHMEYVNFANPIISLEQVERMLGKV